MFEYGCSAVSWTPQGSGILTPRFPNYVWGFCLKGIDDVGHCYKMVVTMLTNLSMVTDNALVTLSNFHSNRFYSYLTLIQLFTSHFLSICCIFFYIFCQETNVSLLLWTPYLLILEGHILFLSFSQNFRLCPVWLRSWAFVLLILTYSQLLPSHVIPPAILHQRRHEGVFIQPS